MSQNMNKKEESFKKQNLSYDKFRDCVCGSNQGLFIPSRQLSFLIVLIAGLLFSFFIAGYFLGKQFAIQQFTQDAYQQSISDHIYTSTIGTVSFDNRDVNNAETVMVTTMPFDSVAKNNDSLNTMVQKNDIFIESNQEEDNQEQKLYYAQLIGYSTEKAATKFVQKLASKNIETIVKKRMSKTAKGRVSYWYQVVTMPTNQDELIVLKNRLEKEEGLKGVCISSC